ncbi:gamma-tubulin complex component 3 homolog isoform X2 [Bacillus rossius redtenbacheri]|uniref:gamma-tubulin complex component 3 homolog isoform X2 n=1 Tax=Bacillus rossius redtenbacheri TaxID=93214 RepID=UPI002FDC91BF
MSKLNGDKSNYIGSLLHSLCLNYADQNEAVADKSFHIVSKKLTQPHCGKEQCEFVTVEKIKGRIGKIRGQEDVHSFVDLYHKLTQSVALKNRGAVLNFLLLASLQADGDRENNLEQPFYIPLLSPAGHLPAMPSRGSSSPQELYINSSRQRPAPVSVMQQTAVPLYINSRFSDSSGELRNVQSRPYKAKVDSGSFITDVSESALLQELIYSFQGIDGKILKWSKVHEEFVVDAQVKLTVSRRRYVQRLAELGQLYMQIQQQCESPADSPLSEEAATAAAPAPAPRGQQHLTLRRLLVYSQEPLGRMRWLAAIARSCVGKKGGALASCAHRYLQHGDSALKDLVRHLLSVVCKPVFEMISRWILEGELDDPHGEFFIAANSNIMGDQLWHEKYRVLDIMVPSFISPSQAKKILATGKSINFLREICHDYSPLKGREELKHTLDCASVDSLFLMEREGNLQFMMDSAYLDTSKRVLDVLIDQYKFLEHLQAMRRYLLLGQGDFIRYLMELLEPELNKSASQLLPHNLMGIMESAIRATNAQFEDADILQRLDVILLHVTSDDVGWDIFSLDYHVAGPIGTIFKQERESYLMLFSALWRTKRMEWVLSGMWKRQVTSSKMVHKVPELVPLMKQMHLLISEMVHFVHQMQYYLLFEVLECSWDELIKQVHQAESLDDIILAHHVFLLNVKSGALLDSEEAQRKKNLSTKLRAVYDLILQLQSHEKSVQERMGQELEARLAREAEVSRAGQGQWGRCADTDAKEAVRLREFAKVYVPGAGAQMRILAKSYRDLVRQFLMDLLAEDDFSLHLLSSRLDFSEYYKRHDPEISERHTHLHRRTSLHAK